MEAMPFRDMLFWFFLTIFGTGTFVIFEKRVFWGTALIVTGLIGVVGCAWPYFKSQQIFAHYISSRPLVTAGFLILSLCLLLALAAPGLHQWLRGWFGFAVVGIVGAILSCGFWWLAGKTFSAPTPDIIYITDPEVREKLERAMKEFYRAKAAFLESPEVYQARAARDGYRKTTEDIEAKAGCLIDTVKVECLPKPPKVVNRAEMELDISKMVVADEMAKSRFWVVRKTDRFRFRVPIVLFLSVTNRHEEPIKIDLLYLESRSPDGGWSDIRMADSLNPAHPLLTMEGSPLVLERKDSYAKDGYGQMTGEYLLPSLYNRLIQPGETATGWIIAEYPKGVRYGDLIGEMRVSVQDANKRWVASKTFSAHPSIIPTEDAGPIVESSVIQPLDFFINED